MMIEKHTGHLAALLTILIWGTTFISTKILLADFQPVEILFFRFIIGYSVLLTVYPKRVKRLNWKQELTFVAAGFCGICLYYLLENIALTYTIASNVGVIISAAPFITAILAHLLMKSEERLQTNFFVGFIVAMTGIILISFNGSQLKLNPVGDILALAAAFVWACYSVLTKKTGSFGLPVIFTTRRTFFYGILFMIPTLFVFDFQLDMSRFTDMTNLLNILYLGICLLLCNLELCCKNIGSGQNKYLYIHGSCHNCYNIYAGSKRNGYISFHNRNNISRCRIISF